MTFETMRDFLDSSTELHKETSKMFHRYAIDAFVLPILPVAMKEGLKGKIHVEGFEGTIEELLLKHFNE